MDRLEAMAVFLKTVEKGSLTAAARALDVPLPTVSRRISELEAHLGARLLLRSTRRLALTDAGAAYLVAARGILEQVDEAERVASGEYDRPRGELVLTAPILFGKLHILPIVTDFLAAYPDIDIRLPLSDRNLRLLDDHVDVAVRIGDLPDSGMVATRVGTMGTVLCVAPDILASHAVPMRPEDLTFLPCVSLDAQASASSWSFADRSSRSRLEVPIRPRLSVTTAEAAVWAAIRGTGFTRVLRYQCADALRSGALVPVLEEFAPDPIPVHLIYPARPPLPLKMRTFLDFAVPRLRSDLSALR